MSLFPSDLSFLPCLFATAFPIMLLGAGAFAQQAPHGEVDSLLARIESARGNPAKTQASLAIEGTLMITFEGVPAAGSVLSGNFREIFAGADRARHTSDLGEQGVLERGITKDHSWEIDPVTGAKAHSGAHAQALRRYFALLGGASARELYRSIVRTGTREIDGREHVVLRMSAGDAKPDTWYVDAASAMVDRIDIVLPTTDGSRFVWGMDEEIESQISFGDWRKVDGVLRPHRRSEKIGPATYTFTSTKIESGATLDPASFGPPESVLKLAVNREIKPAASPVRPGAEPTYQIVEREAQPVASIRVKCKPSEISATLAMAFPEIIAHLNATGAKLVGTPYSRYHSFGEAEIDVEAGIPIAKPIGEKGRVKNGELPAGKAVMTWHFGPYDQLTGAHKSLQAYLDANQLKARGGAWEIYWTDPGMVPDPSKWRTQLFVPIEE